MTTQLSGITQQHLSINQTERMTDKTGTTLNNITIASIGIIYITSTPSIVCVMANHHIMVNGILSVYMHAHFYHTSTQYQTLRININLISPSGIIVIIRHDLVTWCQE